ncbi:glycosyltransferase family 39 protein [Scleroderma citrinum Foug A]|uniref:Dolichyl-phosphate-mannose--protein mannosyltransferase n=1 Tax=Scleroderma citrinum Foug A TaxID=1036808 RepID=A0A0C3DQS1_9AGAM|nr:glycosyltransferase family 39 protein [Scleroderma citrinum Foug A]
MRPGQVQIDFGPPPDHTPRTSSDFEEISYPTQFTPSQPHVSHSRLQESLPLHYMSEDTSARRRVAKGPGSSGGFMSGNDYDGDTQNDDEGKDVYSKLRPGIGGRVTSGRIHRPYPPPPTSISEFIHQNLEHLPPAIYTLFSCWTRFHKIGLTDIVVWDEAHFGKFGSHYLKREFYFDVHPPLGKMLVALAGLLSGYNGTFEFKSGEKYPDSVPYVAMRVMMAMFGVALVPLGWYTAVELGMSPWACHLVALMVLCDVGWLCISRFILLDSMLLFFTFTTVFFLTKFHNQQYQSFSFDWWLWLSLTGISIGCVTSVKWVGLFVTALVGIYTIEDLWDKFGDLRMSTRNQMRHWSARVICLIILPILVYMASFKLHFMILNHSGPGDAQMSSLFQAHLVGNDFWKDPLEVAFGSKITLKNMGWGGGLLHSHVQTFPAGSGQQQVTCYHYKDDNNHWLALPPWDEPEYNPNEELRYLKNGDVLRLQHPPTTRNLHSHVIPAPITKLNYEVSCYGNSTVGDIHDHWVVEVVDDVRQGKAENVNRIHSLTTRLRFRHQVLGCYLSAANAVLPQWGFKQIEVSCVKDNDPTDSHTYWNVESHWNDRLPPADVKYYKSPFLRDFWHLNVAMMTSNNALVPDPDKHDILASNPLDWPWLRLGLRMCGWGDQQQKYYLLGTPIVWWGGTLSLFAFAALLGSYLLRQQRRYTDMDSNGWAHFLYVGKIAFYGWFLHYAPFFIMGRVTYLHHYLPTLYFSVLMFAHVLDHCIFSAQWKEKTKRVGFGIVALLIVANFWWFRGLAWGVAGPINDHWGLQWRKSWNIYNA